MLTPIMDDGLMEHALYNFSMDKKHIKLGPFENTVKRGGDNLLIEKL